VDNGDGTTTTTYGNGNVKTTNVDGSSSTVNADGDLIETCAAPDSTDSSVACTDEATQ
jgi:hypothetical protein